ncbi:serine/threonine-protein kinase [Paucibacter sp. PLA-PC-4]|uniref:serine/threonine-protein kinase n=1 Tax=Paucibacter sp. PLA-PC-4 TaxID=2993655 RepID=UPI0022492CDF|nr:serine/threonine-protein kinase [Paucibacter sp. PLA-PC-4]MCX2862987.1 serine/threonine-protein kinase [Paucibacter sp. PLA-PC-4]
MRAPVDAAAWARISRRFDEALDLAPTLRAAWLVALESSEPEIGAALRGLLAAHEQADDGSLAAAPAGLVAQALVERAGAALVPGAMVDCYRLIEPLGQGGMASVWLAEQTEHVLRRVALKLPHRGLGPETEEAAAASVSRRFIQERDLLAGLEHPHIARLYDAGFAIDGQPYLAMEWVRGQTLTRYADQNRLDLAARLRLFLQVLSAVGHAHSALVIHRDLKPSNILVTPDGHVKLLDFGIAHLLGTALPLDGHTFTPDAAAPEQLAGRSLGTASDIYSLGVVLYELLSGRRPYRLPAGSAEAMGAALAGLGIRPPSSWRRVLAGDLDALVMCCLNQDPAARYASVDALAKDIERHLARAPLAVRGRSGGYLLGRFLSRYRWWVAGGGLLFTSLAGGLGLSLWQMQRAELQRAVAERAAAREEALRYQLIGLFRSAIADPSAAMAAGPLTAKAMLDRSAARVIAEYRDDPQRAGKLTITLADLYGALGDVEGQLPLLEGFLAAAGPQADAQDLALVRQKLANVELLRGRVAAAAHQLAKAEAFWATAPAVHREPLLEGLLIRGSLQRAQGDLEGSLATFRGAIAQRQALSGERHRETALLYNSMAITLTVANRLDEALAAYRRTLVIFEQLGRAEDLDALVIRGNTGTLALRLGRLAEAEPVLKTAFEAQRRRGGDSAAVAAAMGMYGAALSQRERWGEALPVLREALALAERFAGPASPLALRGRLILAEAQMGSGDLAGATASLDAAQARLVERLGPGHLLALRLGLLRARLAAQRGDHASAQRRYEALLAPLEALGAPALTALAEARLGLGEALLAQGRASEAVVPLRAALGLREQLLWAQSWELALARLRLGQALQRSGGPGAAELLSEGRAGLLTQLGPTHSLTRSTP